MKFKIKTTKILSTALAVTMGISLIPWLQTGNTVRAAGGFSKNQDNTDFGVSQIAHPNAPDHRATYWSGSYVYFGSYEGEGLRFRVLDPDTDIFGTRTMFLDCDMVLFRGIAPFNEESKNDFYKKKQEIEDELGDIDSKSYYAYMEMADRYRDDYTWENSDLKKFLNSDSYLYNNDYFTDIEQSVIAESVIAEHDLDGRKESESAKEHNNTLADRYGKYVALTGEKIFVLDVEDIENEYYGYFDTESYNDSCLSRAKLDFDKEWRTITGMYGGYWLRNSYTKSAFVPTDIQLNGDILSWNDVFYSTENCGVAPALNIDLSTVLFSTQINKPVVNEGEEVPPEDPEYKLTFKDPDLQISYPSELTYAQNEKITQITVPYSISGKNAGNASQVSILITDKDYTNSDAEIIYYDKLNTGTDFTTEGTGTFNLPEDLDIADWGTTYHVYIIPEDVNGIHESDYAGVVVETAEVPTEVEDDPIEEEEIIEEKNFESFVERLYDVALGRASEADGKAFWVDHVKNGDLTGADCAREFLNSAEFNDRNLTDEEFLDVLYKVFFDRDSKDDPNGSAYWLDVLKTESRYAVINGFIDSTEWCNVCASYGVRSGATTAKATEPSKNTVEFVKRLYTICLGRDSDSEGLNYWSLGLTNQEFTGTQAVREFIYSREFQDSNYGNEEYITKLYMTFMDREPDDEGLSYWNNLLENGTTRNDVFDSFAKSDEFADICNSYAIHR